MGLWDDLKRLWRDSGDRAKSKAGRVAARQAWRSTVAAVDKVGDDLMDAAEGELSAAERARQGRPDYGPGPSEADAIAARIEAAARRVEGARGVPEAKPEDQGLIGPASADERGLLGLPEEDDAQARARRELERLKAKLATPPSTVKKTL